jgi:uncharacterized protein
LAYRQSKSDLYKNVVYETIQFIERELTDSDGHLYSALDADSEGVEGKYYVWTKEEIRSVLSEKEWGVFADFYNVNNIGYWEHDNYILLRKETENEFCLKHQISEKELNELLNNAKIKLLEVRSKRIRPGLDDKTLCSWNALMITGYCNAYKAFGDEAFLKRAIQLSNFIREKMTSKHVLLHSYKKGEAKINGFLEDYAFVIEAYLEVYETSGVEDWLHEANNLCKYTLEHFYDKQSSFFYFTSDEDEGLIIRKTEVSDNVIPASNSQMARNLFKLHHYLNLPIYEKMAKNMCFKLSDEMAHYGSGYSNWAMLACELLLPYKEIAITGEQSNQLFKKMNENYLPNCLFAWSNKISDLPLLKSRFVEGKDLIYVCENNTCKLPVENFHQAMKLLSV